MQKFIVDRIEGSSAVCETAERTIVDLPLSELPAGIKEGDCVTLENGQYTIALEDTKNRKQRIQKKVDSLFVD